MSPLVPDAVAAVIAAVIDDNRDAGSRRQGDLAVKELRREGFRIDSGATEGHEKGPGGPSDDLNPPSASVEPPEPPNGPQGRPVDPRNPYGRRRTLTGRQTAVRAILLDWAEQHAPDATTPQVDALARQIAALLPSATRPAKALTSKPGATADDARAVAARLEASWQR